VRLSKWDLLMSLRYLIVSDNSGHDYYIPVDRSDEWAAWLDTAEDADCVWVLPEVPEYAKRIDGRFTFTDPKCE
jgi:hypothetical protein